MSLKNVIANHYDRKENIDKKDRRFSPIYNFKNFCNFVKTQLINDYVKANDRVLDLCAGKGSDIDKLMKRSISEYVAVDISRNSIEEARRRFQRDYKFKNAFFLIADVFGENFLEEEKFDVISCQFAFHYAFENEVRLDYAFKNVSSHLEKGGYFILTLPDSEIIHQRLDSQNKYYRIASEGGNRYHFYLIGSIDVSEFIAERSLMIKIATKYNLDLIEEENFEDIYYNNRGKLKSFKAEIKDKDQLYLLPLYKSLVFKMK